MFCPKCGAILRPKEKGGKRILYCNCGFTKTPEEERATEIKEKAAENRKIEIVEEIETHPKIKVPCEKCGNKVAYFWTRQTRGADEPETRFFRCTKCKYTWREYS